jgi:zinc transporter, ZIP family
LISPILQSLFATSFTWFVTAVGASLVFLLKDINKLIFDGMLGFAAGVMLAASYWSLLSPALELCKARIDTMDTCSNWFFIRRNFFQSNR